MRPRIAETEGSITRDGVRVAYEVYEKDAPTIVLLPTWSIVHSRAWKAQIAYLARHWRVVTFDGRGNGRSDRPTTADAYADEQFVADTVAVLDATDTEQAVLVGWSRGGKWAAYTASLHPERVLGTFLVAPGIPFSPHPHINAERFLSRDLSGQGWDTFNLHHWREHWDDFAAFFFGQAFPEPYSSRQREDGVRWALETDPDTMALTMGGRLADGWDPVELVSAISCPVVVVHAEGDRINPFEWGARTAELSGGTLITIEGEGHGLPAREPVHINRLIHQFAGRVTGRTEDVPRRWTRGLDRRPRVLYLSSPIGLGHVRRDLAIAEELAARHDGLQIDWLTQSPVTQVVADAGGCVHPASRWLASESAHLTDEAGEHDLHVFEAFRRMDEVMVANFHVFQEVVEETAYDLVVADEAWDVDLFWHHNPELKRAPLAWITDFVGYLPMPEGGDREAWLTADYNAEMLGLVGRFDRIRDRSLFVGELEDVVARSFGPGLPDIRDWTRERFSFTGYVPGFDPAAVADTAAIRAELGYGPDEVICIVSVGGSGVGADLLRRTIAAFPAASRAVPGLRMIVVAGPRIDPAVLGGAPGVELHAYLPDLYRHLAVCDLAVVQGGLTTTMELAVTGRPFLYFPLKNHFEQRIHVRHRLDRYGAGRFMEYDTATPEVIAAAIAEEVGRPRGPLRVGRDGAARAASALAELLP
ncbi:alpha/beta hydrolase [Nitriliruptor alkaliphilus]|uniref:alpha/beta hydrolase n=1 Tax=Nitriliruptor alkaliphilus TaxID=427918 RepID=UPI000698B2A3|nr:alpha/beta hydrolase [Nitriliruptor alkaliphilus]